MSKAICLFAHPDDEFAIYPALKSEASNGMYCFYLTDGSFNGQNPRRRMVESLHVLKKIGIRSKSVNFIGEKNKIPDGELHANLTKVFDCIYKTINNLESLRALYIPAWEGGHQDHDAVHLIGLALARQFNIIDRTYQFSLYHGAYLPGPFFKVFSPLPANGTVLSKNILLADRINYLGYSLSYPSQAKTWIGLFPFVLFFYLFNGRHNLQKVNVKRILEPPHKGKLLYERRGFLKQEKFVSFAQSFYMKYIK